VKAIILSALFILSFNAAALSYEFTCRGDGPYVAELEFDRSGQRGSLALSIRSGHLAGEYLGGCERPDPPHTWAPNMANFVCWIHGPNTLGFSFQLYGSTDHVDLLEGTAWNSQQFFSDRIILNQCKRVSPLTPSLGFSAENSPRCLQDLE
jgi:hypothetical protein